MRATVALIAEGERLEKNNTLLKLLKALFIVFGF